MAAAIREFRLLGYEESPTVAIVEINGVEVFNGSVEIIDPPPETSPPTVVPMIFAEYNGDDTESQTLSVTIRVTDGSAGFGPMEIRQNDTTWERHATLPDSGRMNLLINGVAPVWPADGGPTLPGGTPEDPEWGGWAFRLKTGDVLTFDFVAVPLSPPLPPLEPTTV